MRKQQTQRENSKSPISKIATVAQPKGKLTQLGENLDKKLCQIHQNAEIVAVCIKPDCQIKSRLLCLTCISTHHSYHADSFIQVQDIVSGQFSLMICSQDHQIQSLPEYIKRVQSTINKEYDSLFSGFQLKIQKMIEDFQAKVIQLKSVNDYRRNEFLAILQQIILDYNQPQEILQSFQKMVTTPKEMEVAANTQFEDQITQIMVSPDRLKLQVELQEILRKYKPETLVNIDILQIQQNFEEVQDRLRKISNFNFSFLAEGMKFIKINNDKIPNSPEFVVENESLCYLNPKDKNIINICYSSQNFDSGVHRFTIQSTPIQSDGHVILGLVRDQNQDQVSYLGEEEIYICLTCQKEHSFKLNYFSPNMSFATLYPIAPITFSLCLDVDNNKFEILDGEQQNFALLNQSETLTGSSWRFFVMSYAGGQFQLVSE